MARYQHLPIYKLSYELLARVMAVTKEYPRDHKFTLGQKIRDEIISLIVLIYRANSSELKGEGSGCTTAQPVHTVPLIVFVPISL